MARDLRDSIHERARNRGAKLAEDAVLRRHVRKAEYICGYCGKKYFTQKPDLLLLAPITWAIATFVTARTYRFATFATMAA